MKAALGPVRPVAAGEQDRLVAIADVNLAIQVIDDGGIAGDIHAAEGLALDDGEAYLHLRQRLGREPISQERAA